MTGLALTLAAGAALPTTGVFLLPVAVVLLLATFRLNQPWHRPRWLPAALLVGIAHGALSTRAAMRDCRWDIAMGPMEVSGWVREVETPRRLRVEVLGSVASANAGSVSAQDGPGCRGPLRVQTSAPHGMTEGMRVHVDGRWISRMPAAPGVDPLRAGVVVARGLRVVPRSAKGGAAERLAGVRARGVARVERRFGRESELVSALLFARRSGLSPEFRDRFAATGTAHLLAISGFHVGVFAGIVIWIVGRVLAPRWAFTAGAIAGWVYVAVLGFPDAATRAVLLLSLLVVGRIVDRPVSSSGALGTALLALWLIDPGVVSRVGAQLSFAGALGIAVWARPWTERIGRRWQEHAGRPLSPGWANASSALAATVAATLATLPLVAWHFERISLVAVPASLGATPGVALALPAILAALALDAVHLSAPAAVAATGAEGLLAATALWVEAWARVPLASVPVSRPDVAVATVGALCGWLAGRRRVGLRPAFRTAWVITGIWSAVCLWPVSRQVIQNGSLEVHMIDVGQGDAVALRTPRGGWVLIDAGPPTGTRLVRELRRRGARTVDVHLISHPDADHVGGSAAVLRELEVGGVAGPGTIRGDGPWRSAVLVADSLGTPWRVLERGSAFTIDGVEIRVLHPAGGAEIGGVGIGGVEIGGAPPDANAASLILDVRWEGRRLLFMGDAPVSVERALLPDLGPIEVLKVGHHGSLTSTSRELLDRTRPEVALVSAGRGNRYGHPEAAVLERLESAGAQIWRTDTEGSIRLRLLRFGGLEVHGRR